MYHLNHKNSIPKVLVTQNRIVDQVERRKNLWFENEQFFMCRSAHDFWLLWKIRLGWQENFQGIRDYPPSLCEKNPLKKGAIKRALRAVMET